ncbi:hypothetical protein [Streptococcus sp.]|nr:hypothetical protein [Streptococcus sp.]
MRPKHYPYSKILQKEEIVKIGYDGKELEIFVQEFFKVMNRGRE